MSDEEIKVDPMVPPGFGYLRDPDVPTSEGVAFFDASGPTTVVGYTVWDENESHTEFWG